MTDHVEELSKGGESNTYHQLGSGVSFGIPELDHALELFHREQIPDTPEGRAFRNLMETHFRFAMQHISREQTRLIEETRPRVITHC